MTIQVSCDCGRKLNLAENLAGKRIRCPDCQTVLAVPATAEPAGSAVDRPAPRTRRSAPEKPRRSSQRPHRTRSRPRRTTQPAEDYDDFSEQYEWDPPAARARPRPRRTSSRSKPWLSRLLPFLIVGGIGMGILLAVSALLDFGSAEPGTPAGPPGSAPTAAGSPPVAPDPGSVEIPARPTFAAAFPDGVQMASVSYAAGSGPGMATQLRIYLPPGPLAEKSSGCVLVAPAGTNLLCGSDIDGEDYHDEALPYARAGYVAIRYSLDGGIADMESASPRQMATAYQQFRAADGGVANAAAAINFVLARLPEVDPARIYTAGHSSAGTVALLAAIRDTRVSGCIAFAPCSDPTAFHSDFANEPFVQTLFPEMRQFDATHSPMQLADQLTCPVFLFQAIDDTVVAPEETRQFARRLMQTNQSVTVSGNPSGGHYDAMINPGIPRAIEWLQTTDAARVQ